MKKIIFTFSLISLFITSSVFAQTAKNTVIKDQVDIALMMNDLLKGVDKEEVYNASNYRIDAFVAAGLKVSKIVIERGDSCYVRLYFGNKFSPAFKVNTDIKSIMSLHCQAPLN